MLFLRETGCLISFSRKSGELARVEVSNHEMPTAVIENVPNNNDENEEKDNEDEPLYSKVDGQHNPAVTIGASIEFVIKTNKNIVQIKQNKIKRPAQLTCPSGRFSPKFQANNRKGSH